MKKILWLLLLVSLSVSAQTKMGPIVVQSITIVNGTIMTGSVTLTSLAGGGTQCLQINNSGVISGTGSACGGGGGGSVTGPGSSIVGDVVIWANTAGNVVADGGFPPGDVRTTAPNVYDAGVRNWFESDATNAGINIRSTASALPPTVLNGGDLYVVANTPSNCRMTGQIGLVTGNMPIGFAVNSFGTVECFAALSDFGQNSGGTILHTMPRAILPENVVPARGELVFQTIDDNYLATTTHAGAASLLAVIPTGGALVNNTDCVNFVKTGTTVYINSAANAHSTSFPCFDAANPLPIGSNTISSVDAVYFYAHPLTAGADGLIIQPVNTSTTQSAMSIVTGSAGGHIKFLDNTHSNHEYAGIISGVSFPNPNLEVAFELTPLNGHQNFMLGTLGFVRFFGDTTQPLTINTGNSNSVLGTTPFVALGGSSEAGTLRIYDGGFGNSFVSITAINTGVPRNLTIGPGNGTIAIVFAPPTINAGACWKTSTQLGWCGAGQCGTVCN